MNTKDKIAQAKERIKELQVMIDAWEATLPKKKYAPFKLDCFGFLGIILMVSGVGSAFFVYFAIMEILK